MYLRPPPLPQREILGTWRRESLRYARGSAAGSELGAPGRHTAHWPGRGRSCKPFLRRRCRPTAHSPFACRSLGHCAFPNEMDRSVWGDRVAYGEQRFHVRRSEDLNPPPPPLRIIYNMLPDAGATRSVCVDEDIVSYCVVHGPHWPNIAHIAHTWPQWEQQQPTGSTPARLQSATAPTPPAVPLVAACAVVVWWPSVGARGT
uniref:Uncharacterized protein n=1 Tax=Eutreptiella gymnastica TaxID=73025 RepID=A0A7S4CUB1_9EUGL